MDITRTLTRLRRIAIGAASLVFAAGSLGGCGAYKGTPPEAPTHFQATPENRMVRLNWTPSLGATYYEIWRNTVNDPATC